MSFKLVATTKSINKLLYQELGSVAAKFFFSPSEIYCIEWTKVFDVSQINDCDEGLTPSKDDDPWHMLRRKGVP